MHPEILKNFSLDHSAMMIDTNLSTCQYRLLREHTKTIKSKLYAKKKVNANMLPLNLPPLHAWIRFMQDLLHITYRLEIKT